MENLQPIWGLIGTIIGMIGAFNKIGSGGMGKPELLANDMRLAMLTTAAGFILCPIGIVILIISIIWIVKRNNSKKTLNQADFSDSANDSKEC